MKQLIPSLNGLRALSIFCVLFAHILLFNFHFSENPGGQVGVNIFFVISGYLITLLLLKEETASGTVSLRQFYFRRTIRIFPVYYFLLGVYALMQLSGLLSFSMNSWVTSLTYTKYFADPAKGDWETGHLWSLSAEEHFYFIWPLVFKFLKRYRMAFAIAIIILTTLTRLYANLPVMHLFTRADALMWGCVFAIYNNRLTSFVTHNKRTFLVLPFIVLVTVLLLKRASSIFFDAAYEPIATAFFGSYGLLTNISIGFIILASINFKGSLWFKMLNTPVLDFIGRISYSIYLWQQLFFSPNIPSISRFPYNLFMIVGAAILSYYFIEQPFLKLKKSFAKRPILSSLAPAVKGTSKVAALK